MTKDLTATGPTDVGPAMTPEEIEAIFGSSAAGARRPKLNYIWLDKDTGKFNVSNPDGAITKNERTYDEYDEIQDAVICFSQQQRIKYDPDAPPTSGDHTCRSNDGVHPTLTVSDGRPADHPTTQLCATCRDGRFATAEELVKLGHLKPDQAKLPPHAVAGVLKSKSAREDWKPKCGGMEAVLLWWAPPGCEPGFYITRIQKTALEDFVQFYAGFKHKRMMPWDVFVSIVRSEKSGNGLTWSVPKFKREPVETPADIRHECKQAWVEFKDFLKKLNEDGELAPEDAPMEEDGAPDAPQAPTDTAKTVEVKATPAPPADAAPADTGKRATKASF